MSQQLAGQPAGLTLIITYTHIFHTSQKDRGKKERNRDIHTQKVQHPAVFVTHTRTDQWQGGDEARSEGEVCDWLLSAHQRRRGCFLPNNWTGCQRGVWKPSFCSRSQLGGACLRALEDVFFSFLLSSGRQAADAVSYTHLTLPTTILV